jgi:hypothetical protein
MAIRYKGQTLSSGQALANAMTRDLNQAVARKVRQAASSSGLRVRRTSKGLEVYGDAAKMSRFHNRFRR